MISVSLHLEPPKLCGKRFQSPSPFIGNQPVTFHVILPELTVPLLVMLVGPVGCNIIVDLRNEW